MDEQIREYLLCRGLNATLKALDSELRQEKDKGFRVDKILEQIHSYISGFDVSGLNEYWSHLEACLYAHLDVTYGACIRKLHASLLRVYLVGAVQAGRSDRVSEFFERMIPHMHSQADWKDWFMLPYVRNPEEHPVFSMYFNKQWQDTVFLSLHNFLSIVVTTRRKAAVCNYEHDMRIIRRLEEQNIGYRQQIAEMCQAARNDGQIASANDVETSAVNAARHGVRWAEPGEEEEEELVLEWEETDVRGLPPVDQCTIPNSVELMDDFHAISQSKTMSTKPRAKKEQLKTFIRSITTPSSPIIGKKATAASNHSTSASMFSSSVPTPLSAGLHLHGESTGFTLYTTTSNITPVSNSVDTNLQDGTSSIHQPTAAAACGTSASTTSMIAVTSTAGAACTATPVGDAFDGTSMIARAGADALVNAARANSEQTASSAEFGNTQHMLSLSDTVQSCSVGATGADKTGNSSHAALSYSAAAAANSLIQPKPTDVVSVDSAYFCEVAATTTNTAGAYAAATAVAAGSPNVTTTAVAATSPSVTSTAVAAESAVDSFATIAPTSSTLSTAEQLMREYSESTGPSSSSSLSHSDDTSRSVSQQHVTAVQSSTRDHRNECERGLHCISSKAAGSETGEDVGGNNLNGGGSISTRETGVVHSDVVDSSQSGSSSISGPIKHPIPGTKLSPDADGSAAYLLLSQEVYSEHTSCVVQCRFSSSGQTVATLDADGVLKAWTIQPTPVTLASTMSQSSLTALEWAATSDSLILLGSKIGSVRLFDIKEKRTIKEVSTDPTCPRFISIASHPMCVSFACSSSGRLRSNVPLSDISSPRVGKLSIWDFKTMKVERYLPLSPGPIAVNSIVYDSGSGTSILTGAADGFIRLFDVRSGGCVRQWLAHKGEINTTLFNPDDRSCYSLGADGKLMHWSLGGEVKPLADMAIHAGASGPFVTLGGGPGIPQRLAHSPRDKLFALDSDGKHILTCTQNGGLIYKIDKELGLMPSLSLEGHRSPVLCVDWSSSVHYKTCLTAGVDGQITVSTLLIQ